MVPPLEVTDSLFKMCIQKEEEEEQGGVVGVIRDGPPAHYTFKIKSFSELSNCSLERFESGEFEAGGYKWKLLLYPNGDKKKNVKDHISLYLMIVGTKSLPPSWVVNAEFRFFLYDQMRDKYLALGDIGGRTKRFHQLKTECGFSKLLPLSTLNDPSNGYLVDDACVFGAEVHVCDSTGKGDCLSMINGAVTYKHTWNVKSFSQFAQPFCSELFTMGGHRWQIKIYPRGNGGGTGTNISVYLFMEDYGSLTVGQKVLTKFTLWIKSQGEGKHNIKHTDTAWFSRDNNTWGSVYFMELRYLKDPSNGFLLNDTCVAEAEVSVLGVFDNLANA